MQLHLKADIFILKFCIIQRCNILYVCRYEQLNVIFSHISKVQCFTFRDN